MSGSRKRDTIALSLNSPAVDAGDVIGCHFGPALLAIDQRGRPRKTDGDGDGVARCDSPAPRAGQVRVGAYELQLSRLLLPLVWR